MEGDLSPEELFRVRQEYSSQWFASESVDDRVLAAISLQVLATTSQGEVLAYLMTDNGTPGITAMIAEMLFPSAEMFNIFKDIMGQANTVVDPTT